MTLGEILTGVRLHGSLNASSAGVTVTSVEYDSRRAAPGTLFFAFQGKHADGRQFAADAVGRGAVAVASEEPGPAEFPAPWIQVEHGRQALATAARNLFGPLDESLTLVGVTGTNGKTTVSYVADSMLRAAGKITALVGTIQYHVAGQVLPAPNTTPESLDLYRLFQQLTESGGTHVTMEVSSHALALGRVYGLRFHTALFTNLTRDHLDFHGTMEEYFAAKRKLFEGCGAPPPRFAGINLDDPRGRQLPTAPATQRFGYGTGPEADVRARNIDVRPDGLRFDLDLAGRTIPVRSGLIGLINVYNILAASCAGLACGLAPEAIAEGIEKCHAVPGRFERVDCGQPFTVVVDYAHTDDALANAIRAARALKPRRVITVFGCGGDRDRSKRPLMGSVAAELSDFVVLTSDNPRSEDPLAIMNDVMVGLGRHDTRHLAEPDRTTAIRKALEDAGPGDLVLIAGKGHETYQILPTGTIHFDDREVAAAALGDLGYRREAR